jgi:hypothetical protein
MNKHEREARDHLIAQAGEKCLTFTCWIAESVGALEYLDLFSPNGHKDWVLGDDPELSWHEPDHVVSTVLHRRAEWRRTALCFAAAMIETGDLSVQPMLA